jgi:hypothetical protein
MEITSAKNQTTEAAEDSNQTVVRIEGNHFKWLKEIHEDVNRDPQYSRKIGFKRIIEALIEDCRTVPVGKLKKEREGSEDWLKALHRSQSPDTPFYDWLKETMIQKKPKNRTERKA